MYIDVKAAEFDWRGAYKLFLGFINPRPIALVSSVSPDGARNLAPFSFYNMVSANPPVVMFCPSIRRDGSPKHTLANVQATREFVVATVSDALAGRMVKTAAELPAGQSEFEYAGLTPLPAVRVKAALVKEAPVNLECTLRDIVSLGDQPGGGRVVLGDVAAVHIADEILTPRRDAIDPCKLRTVGRLGGQYYCTVTDPYELHIPKV